MFNLKHKEVTVIYLKISALFLIGLTMMFGQAISAESPHLVVAVITEKCDIDELHSVADAFASKEGMEVEVLDHRGQPQNIVAAMATLFTGEIDVIIGVSHYWLSTPALRRSMYPLDKYFQEKEIKTFLDLDVNAWRFDEKTYGIPTTLETSLLIINQNQVKEAPKTWDDLKTTGFLFDAQSLDGVWPFFSAYGVTMEDVRKGVSYMVDPQKGVKAANFIQELSSQGVIMPQFANSYDMNDRFGKGEVGIIIGGSWLVNEYVREGLEVTVAPLPKLPDGRELKPFSFVEGITLNSYSSQKDVAAKFIRYLSLEEENFERLWLGNFWAPSRRDMIKRLLEDKKWKEEYPIAAQVTEQVSTSHPFPNSPEVAYLWDPISNALSDILFENVPSEKALKTAEEEFIKKTGSPGIIEE